MPALLAMLIILLSPIGPTGYDGKTQLPQSGVATYYGRGLMEAVYTYRISVHDIEPCPHCLGYVAMLRPSDIGRTIWLRRPNHQAVGPYLVIDCSSPAHYTSLVRRNWVVDIPYELALEWHMRGPLTITIQSGPDPTPALQELIPPT